MSAARVPYGISQLAAIASAALMLCLAALWNGQPFFYPDTPTYLRGAEMGVTRLLGPGTLKPWLPPQDERASRPAGTPATSQQPPLRLKPLTSIDDKVVLAGRSVYYGALLYAGYLTGGMWLTVAVQALSAAYLLHLLMARLWGLRGRQVVGVAAAISLLSPLGVYAGFLMPDVFAPVVILSLGVLAVYWQQLPDRDRWTVPALLLFGLCAHASHLALALLMLALLLAARLFIARWRTLSGVGLAVVAGCIVGALGAEWAFNKAVTATVGAPPLRLPHPMARLIDLGPGTDFLKQHCPQAAPTTYAACAYLQNYPTGWEDFLFSTDPAKGTFALADPATKRRLSDEQLPFVVDVLRHDPVGVVGGIAADVLRQIGHFRVDLWGYGETGIAKYYGGRVPDSVYAGLQNSRAARPSRLNQGLTITTYASVLAAVVLSFLWWLRRMGSAAAPPVAQSQRRFADFAALAVAGVLANAIVCATLASSLDRFQARVIWLLPFLALAALVRAQAGRHSPSHAPSFAAFDAASVHQPSSDSSLQGTTS